MVSTAAPSRTMRPRRSSAFTANGRIVSSTASAAGARVGMAMWGSCIAGEYKRSGPDCEPREICAPLPETPKASAAVRLQAPGQDSLLRVQPVLGLVEHHRLRAVHHRVGDLLAAVRRQAMHEDRVRLGARHERRIDLIGLEQVMAARAVSVAH